MKAYLLLADGFEEVEALTTADILIRAGVDVKLVKIPSSTGTGHECKAARGTHDIKIKPDLTLNLDINADDLLDGDCIILPGGMPGTKNLAASTDCIKLIKAYNDAGKIVAAICAAPSVLGLNGLLKGKKATCFPGFEDKLTGASVCSDGAVIDGNIVTGKSMGSAVSFGLAVTEALLGRNAARSVESSIYRG
jgi:4-methyl-5(b-hydroxyethyl)-thiazole monophosphate biosynthesis